MLAVLCCAALALPLSLAAQNTEKEEKLFDITGNLTAIYTLGDAAPDQMLASGAGNGAFFEQKNGYYTQANLMLRLRPASFFESYFKFTSTFRPGSLYVPLSLESYGSSTFDELVFDTVYGKASVFEALDLSLPVKLFLKTGKYKSEAENYQTVSKFGLETILDVLETSNTYNFDVSVEAAPFGDKSAVYGTFTGNYRFDEGIQRLYDNDGGVSDHGNDVLGKFAPQFTAFLGIKNMDISGGPLNAELVYGQNVSGIYSGHSVGFGAGYDVPLAPGVIAIPVGLAFSWVEKNIDVLSHTASASTSNSAGPTYDFRDTLSGAVAAGLRFTSGDIRVDAALAGVYSNIAHIYRDPLSIISASIDAQCTYAGRYFAGAGCIAGTLADAEWKTAAGVDAAKDDYQHTFSLNDNLGFEVYAGLNLWANSRFVVGYNQNKGIAMNYNLENKPEGQIKYKLAGTEAGDKMFETGGLYLKLVMSW